MSRKKVHVVPHAQGWAVKNQGASRATSVHGTKAEAVSAGRVAARAGDLGQLFVHGGDGRIQTEHTYGKDPYPPKG